jgi:hypothetical protein
MSEIESTHRDHADEGTLDGRETYEPPRITSLGTVDELTSGGAAPGGDVDSVSMGGAGQSPPGDGSAK